MDAFPPRRLLHTARYLWAAPVSLLGLCLALPAWLARGQAHWHGGVLEVSGRLSARWLSRALPGSGPVAAITLGHVIIGRSTDMLAAVRAHERVHVGQAERWGPLFLIAYPLAGLLAWARGGHPYLDNVFELEARRIAGY